MDERQIQEKLGLPPGRTLEALVALAEKVSPESPWGAFRPLWLFLPWLKPDATAEQMRFGTPKNVHPFADIGSDHHFGFLMDRDLPTDERPIVRVDPTTDGDATQIVAPTLRDFLSLVAISFAETVSRDISDAEWLSIRKRRYGDDRARFKEMKRLSSLLCTIPGVVCPTSPSKIANAYPDQPFYLVFEDSDERDHPPKILPADFTGLEDAQKAASFAQTALAQGRLDEAMLHARSGMQHPAFKPRCLLVLANAQRRFGQKAAAQSTTRMLLDAWLDPAWISPPAVHPRRAIDRGELISLLEQVEGSQAAPLVQRVRDAPEMDVPSGNFM